MKESSSRQTIGVPFYLIYGRPEESKSNGNMRFVSISLKQLALPNRMTDNTSCVTRTESYGSIWFHFPWNV